jgi:hypothetical protein
MIAPTLSAAQSIRSNCLPVTKNFWINSVVSPQTQVDNVIFINRLIFSFFSREVFLKGMQNKKTIPPKMPPCTTLSKSMAANQGVSGKSSPGKQTSTSTNKNQAMPGANFVNGGDLKEELLLKCFRQFMKQDRYMPVHSTKLLHLPDYLLSF